MKVLAMDTSTLTGSVALVEDEVVLGEVLSFVRANHSEALLPLVDDVLLRAHCTLDAVDMLAVGIGPGSFTGVRIGVSLAKGLRLATGKRLAGVSSLEAVMAAAPGVEGLLVALLDARRGEVFAQVSRVDAGGRRTRVLDTRNGGPETVGAAVRAVCAGASVAATGDLDDALWARFEAGYGGALRRLPRMVGSPLARFVAHEAIAGRCVFDDDDRLEPIYVRASDAKLPGGA